MTELAIGFCLDESGSMDDIVEQTISGFNEYINDLKKESPEAKITLTLFSDLNGIGSDNFRGVYENERIGDIAPLNNLIYKPRGNTPLYDAIGFTINKMDEWLKVDVNPADYTVLFVIQTDGLENASKEYTQETISNIIKKKEAQGWKFIYLGADQDQFTAEKAAIAMGLSANQSMSYNKVTTSSTYAGLSSASSVLRANPGLDSSLLTENLRKAHAEAEKNRKEKTPSGSTT